MGAVDIAGASADPTAGSDVSVLIVDSCALATIAPLVGNVAGAELGEDTLDSCSAVAETMAGAMLGEDSLDSCSPVVSSTLD